MATPTKENTLYLPVSKADFDNILAGDKKELFRVLTDTNYRKYIESATKGDALMDLDLLDDGDIEYYDGDFINACKDVQFPFYIREFKFVRIASGTGKERRAAIIEISSITTQIAHDKKGQEQRFNAHGVGGYNSIMELEREYCSDGDYCIWQLVYHLGSILKIE